MKKFLFLSVYTEKTHIHFDASMLNMFLYIYPNAEFYFFGNKNHLDNVVNLVTNGHKIKKIPSNARLAMNIWLLYFIRTFFLKKVYRIDLCGFFASPPYFLVGFLQHEVILHVPWWHIKRPFRLITWYINFQLVTFFCKRIKYITLGKWIMDNYLWTRFLTKEQKAHICSITHPFLLPSKESQFTDNQDLLFWFLWSSKLPHKWSNPTWEIQSHILYCWGKIIGGNGLFLSPEEFYPSVHYVVLCYLQNYSYMCSGIFIESIAYKKPIICFSSPISNYFFSKYWPLWYECDSLESMQQLISKLILHKPFLDQQYEQFLSNLSRAKNEISDFEYVSNSYLHNIHAKKI